MAKRKKKPTTKAPTAKPKSASRPQAKWPHGSISSGICDAVEKLVAGGKMNHAEAFRQLAKESGRKKGTVSVNYYYAAKRRRMPGHPRDCASSTIYDCVEKLIAERKLTRAAAFRQIARETGRLEGTVGVNYYYAAKKRGVKFPKRRMPRKAIAGPKLEGVGKRLAARPGVPAAKRPKVDVAKLIERERNRWPW